MHVRQGKETRDAAYQELHHLIGFQTRQSSFVKPGAEEPFRRGPAGPRLPDWWKFYLTCELESQGGMGADKDGVFLPSALVLGSD